MKMLWGLVPEETAELAEKVIAAQIWAFEGVTESGKYGLVDNDKLIEPVKSIDSIKPIKTIINKKAINNLEDGSRICTMAKPNQPAVALEVGSVMKPLMYVVLPNITGSLNDICDWHQKPISIKKQFTPHRIVHLDASNIAYC